MLERRLVWLSLLVMVGTLASAAHARVLSAQQAPPATELKIFAPWEPDGTLSPSLQISSRDSFPELQCQSESISTTRPDAWRCGTDDPCFAPFPFAQTSDATPTLACAAAGPWTGAVQLLTVQTPLPSSDACQNPPRCRQPLDLTGNPWAIELANGVRCTLFTGTITSVAGIGMTYGCANQDGTPAGTAGSATKGLDRTQPLWQVFYQDPGDYVLQQVGVLVAWY